MSFQKPLTDLLHSLSIECNDEVMIQDLALDSRKVVSGSLFLAYPGTAADGRDFMLQAQEQGAAAILYEAEDFEFDERVTVPALAVPGLQYKAGVLAHHFFDRPSSKLQLFGITGTNGKTTCCYLLTQALEQLGMQAAMIGTIGVGRLGALSSSGHTTPDPVSVHRLLAQWQREGITQVCMEVSSHALDQGRVSGLHFFCTLFTNLSHDHLDYHASMEDYAAAKQRLFTDFHSELMITNADDSLGAALIDVADSDFIASYSADSDQGHVAVAEAQLGANGISLAIEGNGVDFTVSTPLIGQVNVPNVLLLITTLLSLSTPVTDIKQIVAGLRPAPGRMELYSAEGKPQVVVDYAHTPDALEKALHSVRQHCQGQLWCLFGCGGDRDHAKRPLMGRAADQLADQVIITNDNSRSENPELIASEIALGMQGDFDVILDRRQAIETAISRAGEDDWVLVAGKGHETTQEIEGEILPFSDRDQVADLMEVAA